MDLTEIGLGRDVDWIDVTQDSSRWRDVVSIVINFRVPQNASNFLNIWEIISLSRKTLLHEVGLGRQFYNLLQNCITACESAHWSRNSCKRKYAHSGKCTYFDVLQNSNLSTDLVWTERERTQRKLISLRSPLPAAKGKRANSTAPYGQ